MAITYKERIGSCTYSIQEGGAKATRIFEVPWADGYEFAKQLYGRYTTFPLNEYVEPAVFPYMPHLKCQSVDVEGEGKADESSDAAGIYITYDKAKVTAKYGVQDVGELGDSADPATVEEENISVAAEMKVTEEGAWEWSDGTPAKDSALPGLIESVMQFSVTRFHVASLPDSTIAGLCGKLNNADWRGYTEGYVLFMGAEGRRSITVDGAEDWEITYIFRIKPHHWNYAYRSSAENYQAVRVKGGTDTFYQLGAFGGLGV